MPRKLMTSKDWADLTRHIHNQGIAEIQTKGFSEEEESREIKRMFQDVWNAGYRHIHTLNIVPSDGREPYSVHKDSIARWGKRKEEEE